MRPTPMSAWLFALVLLLASGITGLVWPDATPQPSASPVSPEGAILISPHFQQLGASFAEPAPLPTRVDTTPPPHPATTRPRWLDEMAANQLDLSGAVDWSCVSRLPHDLAWRAAQDHRFGPFRVLTDGQWFVLLQARRTLLAWEGFRLATTGPFVPPGEPPGGPVSVRLIGPPPGTDLDGDGVPDLLILDYSGGAHCCSTVKHLRLTPTPELVAQISGWDSTPAYRDLDGDGRYEMQLRDHTFAYWNASFAESPLPLVTYRIERGHYRLASDLMRRTRPEPKGWITAIETLRAALAWQAAERNRPTTSRRNRGVPPPPALPTDEEAYRDLFAVHGWRWRGVCIPAPVWDILLTLIYSGQCAEAQTALDRLWPKDLPHRDRFLRDLFDQIRSSPHGAQLPWLEEAASLLLSRRAPGRDRALPPP